MSAVVRRPLVVPKTSRRELIIGLAAGLIIITLLVFGIIRLTGSAVEGTLTGTITARNVIPRPATSEITIGSNGVRQARSEGDCTFNVHVATLHKDYTVWVDPTIYRTKQIGDEFTFPRPAAPAQP